MSPSTATLNRARHTAELPAIGYSRTRFTGSQPVAARRITPVEHVESIPLLRQITGVGCPADARSLVDVLRYRAANQGECRAYTFLADGESRESAMTYAQLDESARAVAATLQGRIAAGDRVLLMFPPGLSFVSAFLGCLYAGGVPVPLNPPRSNRHMNRVHAVVADAGAAIALTDSASASKIAQALAGDALAGGAQACTVIAVDTIEASAAADWRPIEIAPESPAFLQYTSGSTGTPKGVVVTHANLMANEAAITEGAAIRQGDVGVIWLPMYHDMGLIGGVLNPLYCGYPCVLMAPTQFLQDPIRWLRAITRYRGTVSAAPNFALELCLKSIKPADLHALDLSSWRVGLNGAEPVRAETLERFTTVFGRCGFDAETHYPSYGLAEATLFVTGGRVDAEALLLAVAAAALGDGRAARAEEGAKARRLVGCGRAVGCRVVIADPMSGATRALGEVGEIWIAGPSVAAGYWGRPVETEQTFNARLSDTGEGPFLRTGDLGFLGDDGELFVTGRCKDLVVIRGRNIYPQDVEQAIERLAAFIKPNTCAVFGVEIDGEEALGALIEADRALAHQLESDQRAGVEELITRIRQAVAEEFDVSLATIGFVKPGTFPRTSSGKVQRSACKNEIEEARENTLFVSSRAPRAERAAPRESALASGYDRRARGQQSDASLAADTLQGVKAAVAEVCGIASTTVRDEAFLIAYDIDSLRKVELLLALEETFGVKAEESDPQLLDVRTVRDLATFICRIRQENLKSAA